MKEKISDLHTDVLRPTLIRQNNETASQMTDRDPKIEDQSYDDENEDIINKFHTRNARENIYKNSRGSHFVESTSKSLMNSAQIVGRNTADDARTLAKN